MATSWLSLYVNKDNSPRGNRTGKIWRSIYYLDHHLLPIPPISGRLSRSLHLVRQKEWLYGEGRDLSAARHASALSVFGSGDVLEKKISSRSFDTREEKGNALKGREFDYMIRPFIPWVVYHGTRSHAPVFVWLLFSSPWSSSLVGNGKILVEGFLLRRNFPCLSCKWHNVYVESCSSGKYIGSLIIMISFWYACAQCLTHHPCTLRIGCVLRTTYIDNTVIYCLMLLNQPMKFHCLIARVSYCMEEYFSFHQDVTDNSIHSTMLNR